MIEKPDFLQLNIKFNETERCEIAICFLECAKDWERGIYISGRKKGKVVMQEVNGQKHFRLHKRALGFYAEMHLRDRNKLDFIYRPDAARSEIYANYPRGTRYRDREDSWWLPLECVKPEEIERVKKNKAEYGYYKDYCAKRDKIPQKNRITKEVFHQHFKSLIGEGPEHFYGVRSGLSDGPEPLEVYLKIGIANTEGNSKARHKTRASYDAWYDSSPFETKWDIPLTPISEEAKQKIQSLVGVKINSAGKAAEELFIAAFETNRVRWRDSNERYLREYFRIQDKEIQEISAELEKYKTAGSK